MESGGGPSEFILRRNVRQHQYGPGLTSYKQRFALQGCSYFGGGGNVWTVGVEVLCSVQNINRIGTALRGCRCALRPTPYYD